MRNAKESSREMSYQNPNNVDLLLGDATKAKNKLGWECKFTPDDIIDDMLNNTIL